MIAVNWLLEIVSFAADAMTAGNRHMDVSTITITNSFASDDLNVLLFFMFVCSSIFLFFYFYFFFFSTIMGFARVKIALACVLRDRRGRSRGLAIGVLLVFWCFSVLQSSVLFRLLRATFGKRPFLFRPGSGFSAPLISHNVVKRLLCSPGASGFSSDLYSSNTAKSFCFQGLHLVCGGCFAFCLSLLFLLSTY